MTLLAGVMSIVLLAGCGDPVDTMARAGSDQRTTTPPTTTTTSTTTTNTTTSAATTTTLEAAPATTTTADLSSDPVLATGDTFTPSGTVVSTDLPEGAIGPEELIVGNDGTMLRDRIGVATYRLRTEVVVAYESADSADRYVIAVDVVEDADPTKHSSHEQWFSPGADGDDLVLVAEIITIGSRRFAYSPENDEWTDVGFAQYDVGPVLIAPTTYAFLDVISQYVSAHFWLGNEDVDGVPVGHYEIPPYPDLAPDDSDGPVWEASNEFWIDADGVVWRWLSISYFGGRLWQSTDTVLSDLGAEIDIEAPTP